jgi:hypothetical protein
VDELELALERLRRAVRDRLNPADAQSLGAAGGSTMANPAPTNTIEIQSARDTNPASDRLEGDQGRTVRAKPVSVLRASWLARRFSGLWIFVTDRLALR